MSVDDNLQREERPLLLCASYTAAAEPPDAVSLHLGGRQYRLQGRDAGAVMQEILPHIDGFSSQAALGARLAQTQQVSSDWVERVLSTLIRMGLLVEDHEERGDRDLRQRFLPQITYLGQYCSFPSRLQKRLHTSRVSVIGLGYSGTTLIQHLAAAGVGHIRALGTPQLLHTDPPRSTEAPEPYDAAAQHRLLEAHLRALGTPVEYDGRPIAAGDTPNWSDMLAGCDLAVLVLPAWQSSIIRQFNRTCLERHIPFLPVWFDDAGGHIGPLVWPFETACLCCLELRRQSRWTREELDDMLPGPPHDLSCLHHERAFFIPWVHTVTSMACGEIVTALTQYRQPTSQNHELVLTVHNSQLHRIPVAKVPRCPACSRLNGTPPSQAYGLGS